MINKPEPVKIGPHLLGIAGLSLDQVHFILDTAEQFVEVNTRSVKKVPSLRGKTIINLFLEASTRTRTSFEIAAKRLSADAINISAGTSSVTKGESLMDTAYTLQSMSPDVIIIRHGSSGAPHFIAKLLDKTAVVNAGDGLHEHPTQALLDLLSIKQRLGRVTPLKLVMVGDVLRSRVARSNIILHRLLGNEVTVVAPPTLAMKHFEQLGVRICHGLNEGLKGADVVMSLRMKFEYLKDTFIPNLDEYSRLYCLTEEKLKELAPESVILAPGPFYRGVELSSELVDGPRSLVGNQVENGVAVRMAVLFLLSMGRGGAQS